MRSSTSGSEEREESSAILPRGSWVAVWVAGGLLALCAVIALELYWRHRGHVPSINSGPALWSYHRDRLEHAGPDTIALLGSSRMQTALVPEVFLEEHPDADLVQLASVATGPFATLDDIARHSRFRGLVLCEVAARTLQPGQLDAQRRLVDFYHTEWGPGAKASLLLSAELQERLVVLRPRLGGEQLLASLLARRLPRPDPVLTFFNRRWVSTYEEERLQDVVGARVDYFLAQLRSSPPASAEEWRTVLARLAAAVEAIHARGGVVVFVRFPVGGQFQALEDQHLPDAVYWDPLVEAVGTTAIDHRAMPGVESLHSPDGSHLDSASAAAFTRWLARELGARGYL